MENVNNIFSGILKPIFTFLKDSLGQYYEPTLWCFKIFVIVFLTVSINFLILKILTRLENNYKEKSHWYPAFLRALRRPLRLLSLVIGLTIAANFAFAENDDAKITHYIENIRKLATIYSVAWFAVRFIRLFEEHFLNYALQKEETTDWDKTTIDVVAKLLKITVFITSILITLQSFGLSIGGVLAFGGFGGIAVGFAAKDLLSNFFGAIMIYMDRPFEVGDWIKSPDKEIEGTVEKIGWRQTRIRSFDKRPIYVPNSLFSVIVVKNPSRMTNRRIYETIGVRYDDMAKVANITKSIEEMLFCHTEINNKLTIIVNLVKFNESSVDIMVYCFTHTKEWKKYHIIKEDIMLKIAEIVSDNGAELAFPTQTLHIREELKEASMQNNR